MNDQNLNPTIPNRNIFEANNVPQPASSQIPNKKEIVANTTGSKFSLKTVFVFLLVIAILLVGIYLVKSFTTKSSQSQQVTLTWWSLEEDQDAVVPIINEYQSAHPNVKIQFVQESPQDYAERLSNSLAKGQGPDIFEFHNSWVPMFGGYMSALNENISNSFYPVVTSDLKTKNGLVGIPLEIDDLALFVNQDILNTYGKSVPKTWDDFRSLAQTFTLRDNNGTIQQSGAALGVTSNIDYWPNIVAMLILQNGGDLVNPNQLSGQSALTFYTNFSLVDKVWDGTLPSSTLDFANGKLAMYFGPYKEVYDIKKRNPSLHFEVVPVPQLPTDSSTVPSISYASYWANGVSKNSQNVSAAWDFLKFMSSQNTLRELYKNEVNIRGYGNLYPRVDMQKELLSDPFAGPFVYEAGFARSWYLDSNTNDGATGINTQVSKPYSDAINAISGGQGGNASQTAATLQSSLNQVLAGYSLVAPLPSATP